MVGLATYQPESVAWLIAASGICSHLGFLLCFDQLNFDDEAAAHVCKNF